MAGADPENTALLQNGEKEKRSDVAIEMRPTQRRGTTSRSPANSGSNVGSSIILDTVNMVKREQKTLEELEEACTRNSDGVNFCDADMRTALHHAALKEDEKKINVVKIVQILLDAGADIKYKDKDGNTALHLVVESGSEKAADIFKLLLPPKEKLQEMTVCNTTARISCKSGNAACSMHFRNGAEHWMDTATSINNNGCNVLDLALKNIEKQSKQTVKGPLREIVEYIVRETDDDCFLRLMRNKEFRGGKHSTPMRNLIKKVPEIAKEVLDRCIQQGTGTVVFHYELLDDMYLLDTWPPSQKDYCQQYYQHVWEWLPSKDAHTQTNPCRRLRSVFCNKMEDILKYKPYSTSAKTLKDNSPLMLMIKYKRKDTRKDGMYQELLDHPLVKALVKKKWNHIGIKFHLLNLIPYLIFLILFTNCVVTANPPYPRNSTIKTTCESTDTLQNTTICQNGTTCQNISSPQPKSFERNDGPSMFAGVGVFILAGIMLVKEVYQFWKMYGPLEYLKRTENYVELGVYVSSVIFAASAIGHRDTGHVEKWQWLLGTFSVSMAWINLLSFARQFDTFGIYVGMLWRIIKTFLKNVFLIVVILLIAFATGFNCVRRDQDEFSSFWRSLFVTSSMTITGFEYDRAEFETLAEHSDIIGVTYAFYSLFLVIITIIVINLMVGVAVENVHEIHKRAKDSNSIYQIEYFLEFEGLLVSMTERFNWTTLKKWFVLNPTEEIWLRHLKSTTSGLPANTVEEILRLTKADKVSKSETVEEILRLIKEDKVSKTETVGKEEMLAIKDELANLKKAVEAISQILAKD